MGDKRAATKQARPMNIRGYQGNPVPPGKIVPSNEPAADVPREPRKPAK